MKKLLLILPLLVLISGCGITTRNASYDGYILAVENNGLLFHADRVYTKTDLSSSNEDQWCVANSNLTEQLRGLAENKIRVTIKYHDEFFFAPWRCHGGAAGMIDSFATTTVK